MIRPAVTPYRQHLRSLLSLGLPLVGAALAGFAVNTTDTIMLGWYSVSALAAATLATSYWFVLFIVGAGFGNAVMPMVAAAASAGDETTARRTTRMALWLSLGYCVVIMPLYWWSGAIFAAMGQDPSVAADAQSYLRIAGWGVIPALGAVVLRSYLGALHLTAVQFWVTLASLFLNALINYALIFGNWGAPELGLQGAAIASVAVQTATLIVLLIYADRRLPEYKLFQRIWKADPGALRSVFGLGLPIGMTSFAETGLFTATAVMMGWIGKIELAAHGIALQLAAMAFMFHVGMSQAATIRAGAAMGRRDEADLRRIAKTAIVVSLAFGVAVVALFVAIPDVLVSLFIDPAEPARQTLIGIGMTLVYIAALFQFVDATQIIALSLLRGVQDTTVPMWLAIVSYWVIGMPCSYLLGFVYGWGAVGIWMGLVVGLGAAAVLLMWRFWVRSVRLGASA